MSYPILALVMLAIAAVVGVVALRGRPRLWAPIALTALVTVILTAVFDNVMIAVGIMQYASATRSGLAVGLAPLEDFAYPLAVAVLLPAVWVLLGQRRDADAD